MNQHGPCVGNAARFTGSWPAGGAVVPFTVVTVAPAGRHSCMPGNSGDDAVAPFAEYSELCDTPVFFEIANHESPDTTVYIVEHVVGAAAGAATGAAAGTAAVQAGNNSDIDDRATSRRRPSP